MGGRCRKYICMQAAHRGFNCTSGQCIKASWVCDGDNRVYGCKDGSDENTEVCGADCGLVLGGGFACSDGRCIRASKKCDGFEDCEDGADESTELCEG